MLTKILDWIRGKTDSGSTAHPLDDANRVAEAKAAPYKMETPPAEVAMEFNEVVGGPTSITADQSFVLKVEGGAPNSTFSYSGAATGGPVSLDDKGGFEFTIPGGIWPGPDDYTYNLTFDATGHTRSFTITVKAAVVETAPLTVKAKFKKADLSKMTKKELLDLAAKHGVEVKARAAKAELVKVLSKV